MGLHYFANYLAKSEKAQHILLGYYLVILQAVQLKKGITQRHLDSANNTYRLQHPLDKSLAQ